MSDNLFMFDDFIKELGEAESPGHLDQLELFYEDTEELFASLTEIITSSKVAITYALVHKDSLPALKPNEPVGHLLNWPDSQAGLCTIIRSDQAGACNSFVAAYPFSSDGIKYPCKLLEIRLFNNQLEAQLVALVGEDELLSLTFYDTRYLSDRLAYSKDCVFEFVLRGFAYHLEASQAEDLDQSAVFPREDLGADHYEIQGPVTSVTTLPHKILGQTIHVLAVTMARTVADEPLDVEIYLTAKVLGKSRLPQAGENVSAVIWLQGHLCGPLSCNC